ncbi:hypothetical protein GYMLUDRAFT_38016 [Collybiopsis luxurians FD-317 M1]|nr:hypothetical protein GYMLUDRAFT_38016 [Collybiopsis luxurians FD-317 M1]
MQYALVAQIFQPSRAPRLTSLDVSIELSPDRDWKTTLGRVDMWPQQDFLKMLSYCSPTLESLSLAGIPLWIEDIPELLKVVPALTRLSITRWPIANGPHWLVFFLSLSARESLLLPQLVELNLGVWGQERLQEETVAKLMRSRSRSSEAVLNGHVVCLEKLTIRVGEKLGDTPVIWSTRELDGTVLEIGYEG